MGLGKTVQAIAVMAHLAADGYLRSLVMCPASLLATWEHEVRGRSDLAVHRIHGAGRAEALAAWERDGGVALTTFEGLVHVPLDRVAPRSDDAPTPGSADDGAAAGGAAASAAGDGAAGDGAAGDGA